MASGAATGGGAHGAHGSAHAAAAHAAAGEHYRAGRTDGPVACTWAPGTKEPSPHAHSRRVPKKVCDTVLDAIGGTPMVRLSHIAEAAGLKCNLLAKCEFFNAGGSVKDRIGKRMIEDAEASGRIKPGDVLIEPTSGNTGIGLALAAAVKGYRMIITLPEKMSAEKVAVLKALGAEIVRTPTEAAFDSPESHIGVAKRLNEEIPNSHILNQYTNPSNPLAHYDDTAEEILEACDGRVDMVVIGAGTGGTLTGVARKLKERCPDVVVVGVDPVGSILAEPDALNDFNRLKSYLVEGTGYDFIPAVLDRSLVDRWVKTSDRDSLIMARRLIREEGLLCGGSSGASVFAALQAAKDMGPGKNVVVILADSIRNYLSKFASDDWMWEHGFVDESRRIGTTGDSPLTSSATDTWWGRLTVSALRPHKPISIAASMTCQESIDILDKEGFDQLPVLGADGNILGVVTAGNLASKLMSGRVKAKDPVHTALFKQFRTVEFDTPLSDLARIFDKDHFAIVASTNRVFHKAGAEPIIHTVVTGIVTRIDLLKFVADNAPPTPAPHAAAAATSPRAASSSSSSSSAAAPESP